MNASFKPALLSLAIAALSPGLANALVIDFQNPGVETIERNDDPESINYRAEILTVQGYRFNVGAYDVFNPTIDPAGNRYMNPDNTDRGPRTYTPPVWMERVDGGLFNLDSIDFGSALQQNNKPFDSPWVLDVVVNGWTPSGVQSVHLTVNPGSLQHFDLGLHGLTRAQWRVNDYTIVDDAREDQFTMGLPFDNVEVNAIPEPQTYALMAAGLGLLGMAARRRGRKARAAAGE